MTYNALDVLRELVQDIDVAGGPKKVGMEWPDLVITYNKAKKVLGPQKVTQEDIERMKRNGYLGAGWTR